MNEIASVHSENDTKEDNLDLESLQNNSKILNGQAIDPEELEYSKYSKATSVLKSVKVVFKKNQYQTIFD